LNVKISCDDGDECTIDRCHCDDGCQHFPVSAEENAKCAEWKPEGCSRNEECDDNNPCTEDTCVSGVCHAVAKNCDDNDMCTVDSCNKEKGCTHTLVEGPCNERGHEIKLGQLGDEELLRGRKKERLEKNKEIELIEGESDTEKARGSSGTPELSIGAIIGIVIGTVVAVGLIGLVILILKPKTKK
jgi:hypothetical protein